MDLVLFNTLSRKTGKFRPIREGEASIYTCGPTVYGPAHIGNFRTYIFEDVLKRVLEYFGYRVRHGMNITDVGHLVGDGDSGEDKVQMIAERENVHPLDIARRYETMFWNDADDLNVIPPSVFARATETISEQIEIISLLIQKGLAYKANGAIYFDTSRCEDYGKLSKQNLGDKLAGAREDVVLDPEKKNQRDFALWFFLVGKYEKHILKWESPWGEGFPGWHIECSAISRKLLGQPFDIHASGVDHIGTHHTNEIAQSECAYGVSLANLWMHCEFVSVDKKRMGKSLNNTYTISDLKNEGYDPLAFRYMCMLTHYRQRLNFTWDALEAAERAYHRMLQGVYELKISNSNSKHRAQNIRESFVEALKDDLNLPQAIPEVWDAIHGGDIDAVLDFDKVLGLKLYERSDLYGPIEDKEVEAWIEEREKYRKRGDFVSADRMRSMLEDNGYEVIDTPAGAKVRRKI